MGLTQHRNGVAVIQEVVNLHLLNGHIGTGAGLCPVRGHSMFRATELLGFGRHQVIHFCQAWNRFEILYAKKTWL